MHDTLLAAKPEAARHDADVCPFCIEQATASGTPPGSPAPDVSAHTEHTKGGDTPTMADISQEAHEALVKTAVEAASATLEAALATKTQELADANTKITALETEKSSLNDDNTRLNKELDEAQVKLTSATEEVANLKKDAAEAVEAAKLAEVASARTAQVKNLKLFPEDYITEERAAKWAKQDEASWTEQVAEWATLKPVTPEAGAEADTASAMSGTDGASTEVKDPKDTAAAGDGEKKTPARRLALGLR